MFRSNALRIADRAPGAGEGTDGGCSTCPHAKANARCEHSVACEQLYGKTWTFKAAAPSTWMSTESERLLSNTPWALPELAEAKRELNVTKDKLDTLDIRVWGRHTTFTNRAGNVVNHLRDNYKPEMCTIAWAKMYEMLVRQDLLPANSHVPRSAAFTLHLCEAPGAFICATNHFLKTERPHWIWKWLAVTLNPAFEGNDRNAMIDDDVLIQATGPNWCFGIDNSGDIRDASNIRHIWEESRRICTELGVDGALLVTADGSVDCQEDPNEQERATAPLHFCELVASLGVLAVGGTLVLKAFTLLDHPSVCLLHVISTVFTTLLVTKPSCSKPGNSETYVVGKGFKGLHHEVLDKLLTCVGKHDMFRDSALFPLSIMDNAFLDEVKQCSTFFARSQRKIIEENLLLFDGSGNLPKSTRDRFTMEKQWLTKQWVQICQVKELHFSHYLSRKRLDGRNNNTSGFRNTKPAGTLSDRQAWYAKRREIQGSGTSDFSRLPGPATIHGAGVPVEEPGTSNGVGQYSSTALGIMKRMGHVAGRGLGTASSGRIEPVQAEPRQNRQGLGYAPTPLAPVSIMAGSNDGHTRSSMQGDLRGGTSSTAAKLRSAGVELKLNLPPLLCEEVETWKPQTVNSIVIKGSKFLEDSMLLRLKDARVQARDRAAISDGGTKRCQHSGVPCQAPRGLDTAEQYRPRSWWKMAGLDMGSAICRIAAESTMPSLPPALYILDLDRTSTFGASAYCMQSSPKDMIVSILLMKDPVARLLAMPGMVQSRCSIAVWPSDQADTCADGIKFQELAHMARDRGVNLVIGDLCSLRKLTQSSSDRLGATSQTSHPPMLDDPFSTELDNTYRKQLLGDVLCSLATLQPGGCAVFRFSDCLTTFSVSLLYLLARTYAKVHILKPDTSCALSPERFICCMGRMADDGKAVELLQRVLQTQVACSSQPGQEPQHIVSTFVPYSHLTSQPFLTIVSDANQALAFNEAQAVLRSLDGRVASGSLVASRGHVQKAVEQHLHDSFWKEAMTGSNKPAATWQGNLLVLSPKGVERVCGVQADVWPPSITGSADITVLEYIPFKTLASHLLRSTPASGLHALCERLSTEERPAMQDAQALGEGMQADLSFGKFIAYLMGFRSDGRRSEIRLAEAEVRSGTQVRRMYLVPPAALQAVDPWSTGQLTCQELQEAGLSVFWISS